MFRNISGRRFSANHTAASNDASALHAPDHAVLTPIQKDHGAVFTLFILSAEKTKYFNTLLIKIPDRGSEFAGFVNLLYSGPFVPLRESGCQVGRRHLEPPYNLSMMFIHFVRLRNKI